jgi:hypothetical protein
VVSNIVSGTVRGIEDDAMAAAERAIDERLAQTSNQDILDQRLVDDGQHLLGIALVAAGMRVPSPATGNTALPAGWFMVLLDRAARQSHAILHGG